MIDLLEGRIIKLRLKGQNLFLYNLLVSTKHLKKKKKKIEMAEILAFTKIVKCKECNC